jgi:DNA repair exonuclease SbcCD ATPase subunit
MVNGEEKKFDSINNTEKWLEDKLGMSHTCFKNIIVLNMNNTTPFLSMEASEKRKILEDLLNMKIFGKMSEVAAEKHLTSKRDVKTYENDVKNASDTLNLALNSTENYQKEKEKFENDKNVKIKEISETIAKLNIKKEQIVSQLTNIDYETKIKEWDIVLNKADVSIKKSIEVISNLNNGIKVHGEAIDALSSSKCPTCHVPTSNPLILAYIEENKIAKSQYENILKDELIKKKNTEVLQLNARNKKKELELNNNTNNSLKSTLNVIDAQLKLNNEQLDKEQNREFNVQNIIDEIKLSELKTKFMEASDKLSDSNKIFNTNGFLRKILGEEGIRKFVIMKIIPFFNNKINEYLKMMGSELILKFNFDLEEHITTRNREERSYNSFSGGEKKRIDISILLALMDIAKIQNSVDTNILVLDEVLDTALDNEGIENFLTFLKDGFRTLYPNKAVYIITHRNTISNDFYDTMINVKKKDGFTFIDSIVHMKV